MAGQDSKLTNHNDTLATEIGAQAYPVCILNIQNGALSTPAEMVRKASQSVS